jgi:hypothetical protein
VLTVGHLRDHFGAQRARVLTVREFIVALLLDFCSMDTDVLRRSDPEADLVSSDLEHGHDDVLAEHERLTGLAGQHEHCQGPVLLEVGTDARTPGLAGVYGFGIGPVGAMAVT